MFVARRSAVLFAIIVFGTVGAQAQSPSEAPPGPAPTPLASPSERKPTLEHEFFKNILQDQRAIWLSPFHLKKDDARWLVPLGLSTAALISTDQRTAAEMGEFHDQLRLSHNVSYLGSAYGVGSVAAAFYLVGRAGHNARARETGLLGAEAFIDSSIVDSVLKVATQRRRPTDPRGPGDFFQHGSSFPSGHSAAAWSLATVVANEYHDHKEIQVASYALASAVSLSRFTGRNHFLSDVLVGSAMGYGIGRYVYHAHHDSSLDGDAVNEIRKSKRWPLIAPQYDRRARDYGVALAWSF